MLRHVKWIGASLVACSLTAANAAADSYHSQRPGRQDDKAPFSIVLIPDTQNYAEKATYDVYRHQMQWIVDHEQERNIQFAIHLGDITQHDTAEQWEVADEAHQLLDDAGIPYSMASGNHDLYPSGEVWARESMFDQYFGPERFRGQLWYGGEYGPAPENNYTFFEAGGMGFMVLSLEFLPRKDVLKWADRVMAEHPSRRVIVVTHCHLSYTGEYTTGWNNRYNITGREGQDLWEEFIQRHSTVFMVVAGHIQGVSYRASTGNLGNPVHEILTDYQSEPVLGNGTALGNGWMRTLTFYPESDTIEVESFSTEAGNPEIFVDGEPELYLAYDQIVEPTEAQHNLHNYSLFYEMHDKPWYQYQRADLQFRDRRAHTDIRGAHFAPKLAAARTGNFVAVWEDDRDGDGKARAYVRTFDADGNVVVEEAAVSRFKHADQRNPDVAVDTQGNFVVVWEDDRDSDGVYEIRASGFRANGRQMFHDVSVLPRGAGPQLHPAVAVDGNGAFVVVCQADADLDGLYEIMGSRFSSRGRAQGPAFMVNTEAVGQQRRPDVAMDPGGRFVVTWEDDQEGDDNFHIMARGFYQSGQERIASFLVNTVATGHQEYARIDMDQAGNFVVVWQDDKDGNGYYQIYARGFAVTGAERFADMTVNTTARGQQLAPTVGMSPEGGFYVTFEDDNDGNGYYQVYARGFYADGSQRRSTFTVNSDASGQQYVPSAAMGTPEHVIIAWQDDMDGDGNFAVLVRNFDY